MAIYRIDFLDHDGRVRCSRRAVHQDDREVLRAAARLIGRHQAIEVWDYMRVVGQLTAEECRFIRFGVAGGIGDAIHMPAS